MLLSLSLLTVFGNVFSEVMTSEISSYFNKMKNLILWHSSITMFRSCFPYCMVLNQRSLNLMLIRTCFSIHLDLLSTLNLLQKQSIRGATDKSE